MAKIVADALTMSSNLDTDNMIVNIGRWGCLEHLVTENLKGTSGSVPSAGMACPAGGTCWTRAS